MHPEETDLERRVLAHEQILQALLAQLTEAQPHFLDEMRERFSSARRGAHEHDYVETADYAEAFLHEVMRLVRVHAPPAPPAARPVAPEQRAYAAPAHDPNHPTVVIRAVRESGVWHVTRDRTFLGDYLTRDAARDAATNAMRQLEREGVRARLIFDE